MGVEEIGTKRYIFPGEKAQETELFFEALNDIDARIKDLLTGNVLVARAIQKESLREELTPTYTYGSMLSRRWEAEPTCLVTLKDKLYTRGWDPTKGYGLYEVDIATRQLRRVCDQAPAWRFIVWNDELYWGVWGNVYIWDGDTLTTVSNVYASNCRCISGFTVLKSELFAGVSLGDDRGKIFRPQMAGTGLWMPL